MTIQEHFWLQTDAENMNVLQLKLQATLEQIPLIAEMGTQNGIDMPGVRSDVFRDWYMHVSVKQLLTFVWMIDDKQDSQL